MKPKANFWQRILIVAASLTLALALLAMWNVIPWKAVGIPAGLVLLVVAAAFLLFAGAHSDDEEL